MLTNGVWRISAVSESGCGFVLADDQSVETALGFCCSLLPHYTGDMNQLFDAPRTRESETKRANKQKRLTNTKNRHFYGKPCHTSNRLSSLNFSPPLNVWSQTDILPVTGAEATTVTPADIY